MNDEFSICNWDIFNDDQWHYCVTTFDGEQFKHYIDGIEV